MGDYLRRKPSHESMRRRIKFIETFAEELSMKGLFKRFPNWRTEYGDYAPMLNYAREIARRNYRMQVKARGNTGDWYATSGYIVVPGQLN